MPAVYNRKTGKYEYVHDYAASVGRDVHSDMIPPEHNPPKRADSNRGKARARKAAKLGLS